MARDVKRMLTVRQIQSTKGAALIFVPLNSCPLNIFQPKNFTEIPDSALNDEDLYTYKIFRGAVPEQSQEAVPA